ncbi:MAG: hypothetical protein ACO23H_07860 [Alphaproteobacteria bacterium]
MGVFDFLFGKSGQSGQLDPETKRARDFLLNQMLMQYSAGPVNVPQYMAVAPQAQYSGTNALLSSLGLETVAPPSMPTTTVGGMEVYTSQPFQEQMETSYAERYPGQYDYLRSFYMDPVTGEFGERSYGYADPMTTQPVAPTSGGGGGGNDDNDSWSSSPTATRYSSTGRAPTVRPRLRPTSAADTETTFGADLSRSLSDRSYDPPGTVVSRALDRMFGRG